MKSLCVVFLASAVSIILSGAQVDAVSSGGGAASFYVGMDEFSEGSGSFLISPALSEEEPACRKLSVSFSAADGTIASHRVNEFIEAVNTWYQENTFSQFEWAGEPPYQNPDLFPIERSYGYQVQLRYLLSPHFGLDARWISEQGSSATGFESFASSGDQTRFVHLQGDMLLDVILSGPSLGALWCEPILFPGTTATLFGGIGYYTGTLEWRSSEQWFLQEEPGPPEEWFNLWHSHGRGEALGYYAGADVRVALGENIGLVGAVQYRCIVIDSIQYTTLIEGAPAVSEIPLPQQLDFSGLGSCIGLVLCL